MANDNISSSESEFDHKMPQTAFDYRVISFCTHVQCICRIGKRLTVALFHTLRTRKPMLVVNDGKESASFMGFGKTTIKRYHKQFYDGLGKVVKMKQESYQHNCFLKR